MPFDDTTVRFDAPPTDPPPVTSLAGMDLVAVPPRTVRRHRRKVVADFTKAHKRNSWLVRWRWATWRRVSVTLRPFGALYAISANAGPQWVYEGGWRYTWVPPRALYVLASRVQRSLAGARFEVAYFDQDPILYVCYPDAFGATRRDCLGIWDGDQIIAIAGASVAIERGWWAGLMGRVFG